MNRKHTIEGLKNALWALGFAVGIWFLIDQNIRETKNDIPVRLEVKPPSGEITVTYLDGREAFITVSAPRNVLDKRADWNISAVKRLKAAEAPLNQELPLSVSEFEFVNLPPEVEIVKSEIRPQAIRVVLSQRATAELGVNIDYTNVPEGWEVDDSTISITPPALQASGPREKMQAGVELRTETIDILKQLKYRRWTPSHLLPVTIEMPSRVLASDAGITSDGIVQVRLVVRPKMTPMEVTRVPDLVVPLPGLLVKDRITGKEQAFRLEPQSGGGEAVKFTIVGPDAILKELKDPKVLNERVQALAIVTPKKLSELPNNIGKYTKLPVELRLPEGVRLESEKELSIDVSVTLLENPPTSAATGSGESH